MAAKALIAGYYGFGNTGDEAILSGMIAGLREWEPDLEIHVVSGDPDRTRRLHGMRSSPWTDVPRLIEAIQSSDLVLLGGGGLFHDYWSADREALLTRMHRGLTFYAGIPLLAHLLGKPCALYAVGVGPLEDSDAQDLARIALSFCKGVSVRDPGSLVWIEESFNARGWGEPPKVSVRADPAFLMPGVDSASWLPARLLPKVKVARPVLGVSVRHWDFGVDPVEWEGAIAQALDAFLEQEGGRVLFLPFQQERTSEHEDDSRVCRRISGMMSHSAEVEVLPLPDSPGLAEAIVAEFDVLLAMRMHAALFALNAGVPVLGLEYDPKIRSLMERAGRSEFSLPLKGLLPDQVLRGLTAALAADFGSSLDPFREEMRRAARKNAREALDLIGTFQTEPMSDEALLKDLFLEKVVRIQHIESLAYLQSSRDHELGEEVVRLEARLAERDRALARSRDEADRLREAILESRRKAESYLRVIESQRRSARTARRELSETRRSLWKSGERISALRDQRDSISLEKDELERQLRNLRNTLGVRLLARYWDLMKRFFPIGSRRRGILLWVRKHLLARVEWLATWEGRYRDQIRESIPSAPTEIRVEEPPIWADFRVFEEDRLGAGVLTAVVIFSATQLIESEGQRATNLALEFSNRGIPVVFAYWRWDTTTWAHQDRLEEGIFQIPMDIVLENPDRLFKAVREGERALLIEFPHPALFETVSAANAAGWLTVYDVVDDWDEFHRVGQAEWHQPDFERHLLIACDLILAVSVGLVHRIESLGGRSPVLVPNGVSMEALRVDGLRALERGEVTLGYFGYLSNAWFDWKLVADVARAEPNWIIHLIGYGGGKPANAIPGNVITLGRQPHGSLAGFAANWDVGIVPFKPDRLARHADPIKTYEYLALGLPVVASGVPAPQGGELFVKVATGSSEFVERVREVVVGSAAQREARKAFASTCSWSRRVDSIMHALRNGNRAVGVKREIFS